MKTQTTVYLTADDIKALNKVSTILHALDTHVLKKSSAGLYTYEDLAAIAELAQADENTQKHPNLLIWGNQSGNAFSESIKMEQPKGENE